jgi:prophage maintenance system killer protein
MKEATGKVVLHKAVDGSIAMDVRLQGETVWLTQKQMSKLFDTERSVITKHLRNIFQSKELDEKSVSAKFAHTAEDRKTYLTAFYNLDAIISVGYRVNSKRGTQFRIWATRVLRDHILRGYTVNERRLKELNQAIRLIADVAERRVLSGEEATALLRVVADYSFALDLLDAYDRQTVTLPKGSRRRVEGITLEEARQTVSRLRGHYGAGSLFGRERDNSLAGALQAILQTFGKKELYPTLEGKAAHLLYFLVKNHPFVDGNKRIAATLFLWFLQKNSALYRSDGTKRIADNALVAMTLLIAESRPEEKDLLTRVLVHLIGSEKV